jgi:hypothetical protein
MRLLRLGMELVLIEINGLEVGGCEVRILSGLKLVVHVKCVY